MIRFFIFMLMMVWVAPDLAAQRFSNVLTKPNQFERPFDYYGNQTDLTTEMRRFITNDGPSDRQMWVVYSDRENNTLFDGPEGAPIARKMAFMEKAYVVEKNKDWLQLISYNPAILEGNRIKRNAEVDVMGWIKREKLLLWEHALLDPESKVSRKAVLINSDYGGALDVLRSQVGDTIPVFLSPNGRKPGQGPLIYSFFYVLKKENGFYLLSRTEDFSILTARSDVIGWVSRFRLSEWDTRVALEPNIYKKSYDLRRANPDFRVAHYNDLLEARAHSETGKRQTRGLISIADPADLPKTDQAPEYTIKRQKGFQGDSESLIMKRFEGGVLRFPILGMDNSGQAYFKTTVVDEVRVADLISGQTVGTMSESAMARAEKVAENYREGALNWNVVFVVEGTAAMLPYRDQVLQVVDEFIQYTRAMEDRIILKAGAVVYRDIPDESEGKIVELVEKSTPAQLREALAKVRFFSADPGDDELAALNYGLEQALTLGAYADNQINILVHLGTGGDIRSSRLRRTQDKNHAAMLSAERLEAMYRKMGRDEIITISLQMRNTGSLESTELLRTMHTTILDVAQFANMEARETAEKKLKTTLLANPSMTSPAESPYSAGLAARIMLADGRTPGQLYTPGKSTVIRPDQLRGEIRYFLNQTQDHVELSRKSVAAVLSEGRGLDEVDSRFQDVVIAQIRKHLEGQMSNAELEMLRHMKFRLMLPSYVPKQVRNADQDLFSYVILLNEIELNQAIERLEALNRVLNRDQAEVRRELFHTLFNQCSAALLGGRELSSRDFQKMNYQDFGKLILGIRYEGVQLPVPVEWNLGDIMHDRKVSDGEIMTYAIHIGNNLAVLRDQIRLGNYPYRFTRNGVQYYWIPVEFTI